ncbi:MAG: hypothetical protein LC126_28510 [Bryobacterales bacterium]|nr:hypothetical protein [Bryobacterales bacterium]
MKETTVLTRALLLPFMALTLSGQMGDVVVTSAASFEFGLPPPGSIAAIFCSGLTGITETIQAAGFPLPRELGGVRVTIGGAPAPILAVAPVEGYHQINVQVPLEARFDADFVMAVRVQFKDFDGVARITRLRNTPGDFFRWPGNYREGTGYLGIFQHVKDYSLVTSENPARPGETVIAYLTGMPGTTPPVPTGESAPFSPLAEVPHQDIRKISWDIYTVEYGATEMNPLEVAPLFMGLVPGLAGIYQINFTVPDMWSKGTTWITVKRELCMQFLCSPQPTITRSAPVILPIAN